MPMRQSEARLIVISNRIVREMGFDWLDQVEHRDFHRVFSRTCVIFSTALIVAAVALAARMRKRPPDVGDFYKGRTVTIDIGYSAGGGL